MNQTEYARQVLEQAYRARQSKNPAYSLRAFARNLSVSPGRLSEWMSGKRRLTWKMAHQVSDRLGLDWETRERLLAHSSKSQEKYRPLRPSDDPLQDEYYLVSEPEHFALFALVQTKDFNPDPRWMGKRLGIPSLRARTAWDRLVRLRLVKVGKSGRWETSQPGITTTHDVPSAALRASHRKSLEEAIQALEQVDVSLRDITSITFPMNPEKLPQAKELIKKFRRSMDRLMSSPASGPHTEVYHLHTQLIPATRLKEKKEGRSS